MKRTLVLIVVIMLSATVVFGQAGGVIGTYATPAGLNCNLTEAPGLFAIAVVHVLSPGASAAQFAAPLQPCMIGVMWFGDMAVFAVTLGDSQSGVSIGYGSCEISPTHILTINYFGAGTSSLCCPYPVVANPNEPSGTVNVVDCVGNLITNVPTQTSFINGDATCQCLTPVEETTWGHIKSIYSVD